MQNDGWRKICLSSHKLLMPYQTPYPTTPLDGTEWEVIEKIWLATNGFSNIIEKKKKKRRWENQKILRRAHSLSLTIVKLHTLLCPIIAEKVTFLPYWSRVPVTTFMNQASTWSFEWAFPRIPLLPISKKSFVTKNNYNNVKSISWFKIPLISKEFMEIT